ncbi:hypothetical protein D3C76_1230440 [compost metagenome]
MTKAPIRVPRMVPRPPASEVPPSTTAAMAFISNAVPLAGWLASSCAETTIPAMAAQNPDRV